MTCRQQLHVDDCTLLLKAGNGVFHMQDTIIVNVRNSMVTNIVRGTAHGQLPMRSRAVV